MATLEAQKKKLARMLDDLAKEQARVMLAEKADQRRQAKQAARVKAKERAALFRSADAHRKIVLGGLVIAASADDWDPAEIVGALLVAGEKAAGLPGLRDQLREKGIAHLEARKATR